MATANDVVKIAKQEVGYHEKASNSQLDDKTANSGSGNYNKYARDLDKVNYFNGAKNGYEWCTSFVNWCHFMANGKNASKTRASLYEPSDHTYNMAAGCVYAVEYYKNNNAFYKNNPKVGDQIFFDWDLSGDADHTGIVVNVTSDTVYTIEGNSQDQVREKSYPINYSCIYGYGRPKYTSTSSSSSSTSNSSSSNSSSKSSSTAKDYLSKGDSGSAVKTMQTMLIKCGYSCGNTGADGIFGSATETALKAFQKAYKLTVDGCYGAKTKAKLESVYKTKTASKSYKVKVSHPSGLNLRKTASVKGQFVATMPYGTSLTITETSSNWGKTTYSGKTGWCCLDYTTKLS